jgi:hypothetical protein
MLIEYNLTHNTKQPERNEGAIKTQAHNKVELLNLYGLVELKYYMY